jgi:glutamyl-tRNA synthetase
MPPATPPPYTTRLAPSPTGSLHLGNARTFLITWALARNLGWNILLRIEDLDGPRVKPGAIEQTIDLLQWLGLDWDSGPIIQSHDLEPYRAAITHLARHALAYPSDLTRTQIESAASAPQEGAHEIAFPASLRPPIEPRDFRTVDSNWRFVTPPGPVAFTDDFAGPQAHDPSASVGDFILWTKRAQPSYQLAVVVDDHRQHVTHVVRGDDLLDSASRQLLLYRALGYTPEPAYLHLPLVKGEDGKRLAKRHGDTRLDSYRALGVPPERIIGLLASWSGITPLDIRQPLSALEFRQRLNLLTIPRTPVTFSAEHHAWLISKPNPRPAK